MHIGASFEIDHFTFTLWGYFVDVVKWRDNHVLIFYAIIYYHYVEYTDELQLDDLQVAG
jgi:hypothetical protein